MIGFEEIIGVIKETPYYKDEAVVIYCADCREILPLFPDKSFDLVISINSIHNLPLERLKTALLEIERVSRRNSYITIDAWRNDIEQFK